MIISQKTEKCLLTIVTDFSKVPGNVKFEFQLISADGKVLQTKESDDQGSIVFDKIHYVKDD